jgi:hypothetical protein
MNKTILEKIRRKNVEKQHRRRAREKKWLRENGYESWEALHTQLMNNTMMISKRVECEEKINPLE